MKRKLISRNKRKFTRLLNEAKSNSLSLSDWVELRRRLSNFNADNRIATRYGTYEDWDSAEQHNFGLTVPNRSLKDGAKIKGVRVKLNGLCFSV